MTLRILLISVIVWLTAHSATAQSPVAANYRFGTSCGFDLSSPGPWRPGQIGTLSAGPVTPGSQVFFLLGTALPAPIDLTPSGFPGCSLYLPIPTTPLAPFVANDSFVELQLPLPPNPAIVGLSAQAQAIAIDPTTSQILISAGWTVTVTDGAPSSPPASYPDLMGLTFSCNDPQLPSPAPQMVGDFVAYHTRLPGADAGRDPRPGFSGLEHQISGDRADVVVNLPNLGRLEFARSTSFLPVWNPVSGAPTPFSELVSRAGSDGNTAAGESPDRLNRYSFARIVESSSSQIVVHWRYIPDFNDPTPTGVVHEIFTIQPGGSVDRRVHQSAATLEVAASSARNQQQTSTLTATGLSEGAASPITRPQPTAFPGQSPVVPQPGAAALALSFDEGTGRTTQDSVSSQPAAIEGRVANWHPGVSGTALAFDGYTSGVSLAASAVPPVTGSFTISAWVSLAAYPFGTAPIAGQVRPHGHDDYVGDEFGFEGTYLEVDPNTGASIVRPKTSGGVGYMLAVDAFGRTVLGANLNGQWTTLTASYQNQLPLHSWVHVTGVYDAASQEMLIYQNGIEVADRTASGNVIRDESVDFVVGINEEPVYMTAAIEMPVETFSRSIFGIEGLIDEVRLYAQALPEPQIIASSAAGDSNAPVLAQRQLPAVPGSTFGATSTTISYHKLWDELFHDSGYDDVVVNFDLDPANKIVFWKGMTYGPAWLSPHAVTGIDVWSHDQSMEYGDDHGLCEHMADKQVRHAHARVIEQTPARVVVHWRYAVVAPSGRFIALANELAWVDEYYTIYPDGTCVRFVQDWWCNVTRQERFGWQGCYVLAPPGSTPFDMIDTNCATVVDASGQAGVLSIVNPTPASAMLPNPTLLWTNTRTQDRLYRGLATGSPVTYYPGLAGAYTPGDPTEASDAGSFYSPYLTFNHYPVCQVPDDGRLALFSDRVSHSEGWLDVDAVDLMLYGFAPDAQSGLPMTNFWNNPASVSTPSTTFNGYDQDGHAYEFEGSVSSLSFTLNAAPGHPIQSHGIVVGDWTGAANPTVTVNGQAVPGAQSGIHYNRGARTLVVWVPVSSSNLTAASITIN